MHTGLSFALVCALIGTHDQFSSFPRGFSEPLPSRTCWYRHADSHQSLGNGGFFSFIGPIPQLVGSSVTIPSLAERLVRYLSPKGLFPFINGIHSLVDLIHCRGKFCSGRCHNFGPFHGVFN